MSDAALAVLVAEEEAFLKNLQLLQTVFIALVERETVVPVPVQEELWLGFAKLLEAQGAFVVALHAAGADWQGAYKKKVELLDLPLSTFVGNLPRAVGRLLDLVSNNQWKVGDIYGTHAHVFSTLFDMSQIYMESAEADSKVKGKDLHHFLIMARSVSGVGRVWRLYVC